MQFILRYPLIAVIKLGLYKFSVELLHREYLIGKMSQNDLFDLLHPKQIVAFVEFHKEVKEEFDRSEDLGINRLDEKSEVFRQIIEQSPLLQNIIEEANGRIMSRRDRLRMFFALNQLDNLIEDGRLEKGIKGNRGKNVVRRIN